MKRLRDYDVQEITWRCLLAPVLRVSIAALSAVSGFAAGDSGVPTTFKQYCFQCHGKAAMAGLNLEQLTTKLSIGAHYQKWEKVAVALETKHMPPAKMPQPAEPDRAKAVAWIRATLSDYAEKHAGDPGPVTVRRLTSGEYGYTIQDLTGLDLRFDGDFASDTVGGEGFTNFGDVQFMQDANLERYLEAAKRVAAHAVIGSGPLEFYDDPGKSGLELSAVARIQKIYHDNGFRSVAAEGARPYGIERYGKAFYAAWRYQHRNDLGEPNVTMAQLAEREGINPRFVAHILSVVEQPAAKFPTSEVISRFKKIPPPGAKEEEIRAACTEAQQFVINWPRWLFAAGALAEGGRGDERALLLTDESVQASPTQSLRFLLRGRRQGTPKVYFNADFASAEVEAKPVVIWRNAMVRTRGRDRARGEEVPLHTLVLGDGASKFGKLPDGTAIDPRDFATVAGTPVSFEVKLPAGSFGAGINVTAEVNGKQYGDVVLRLTISDQPEGTGSEGTPVAALLADPEGAGYKAWKAGVLDFAANLPQNSQYEPTPADRDPIPAPFNNTYNQPERDHFHVKLKYYRLDSFIMQKMIDDASRVRLNQAWADLYASFEYHNLFLRFVAAKFKVDLKDKDISTLSAAEIQAMPAEPRKYVKALRAEYDAVMKVQKAAQPGHVEDAIRFASQAWRRPLTPVEKQRLRVFYTNARQVLQQDHASAIRSLLARTLIAPAFLYRLEQPSMRTGDRPLSNWDMANRLSYFLWASMPDQELRRAAQAGELSNPQQITIQVKRMLADPRARRFSTEFFGQWLGFYRFDQYRGVDTTRFPEFTDDVKSGMYDEAVSFFEYIVRKDRPVGEMFNADYTFLTSALAKHYGVKKEIASKSDPERVEGASAYQRGGMLRLGAVLTATSAPLRTSPVKRGDWVLRRILGTPTPPPPPDAGSIPADEKQFGGLSLREKLMAHQRNATCAGCHTRIDPLGFPLESYDSVGRWRDNYTDGKPVDSSSEMADKQRIDGVNGLLAYLKTQEKQVMRTFSGKLLGYALGRTILGSDQPLIDRMVQAGSEASFSKLAVEIATSRQFRYRREMNDGPAPGNQTKTQPAVKTTEKESGL